MLLQCPLQAAQSHDTEGAEGGELDSGSGMCGMSGQELFDRSGVINTARANKQGDLSPFTRDKGRVEQDGGNHTGSLQRAAADGDTNTQTHTHSKRASLQAAGQRRHQQ